GGSAAGRARAGRLASAARRDRGCAQARRDGPHAYGGGRPSRDRPPPRPAAAATRLPTRQRSARARSAALPSRASLQTELGGEIVDEREQDGAGGGEAVALGAALTGAASQLGGARRIVEQAPEGHAQRRRVARTNE